jgi:hypothetical protein
MVAKSWQDQVNAMLGLWLIVSPWVLDYTGMRMLTLGSPNAAVWTALVVGVITVVLSFLDIYAHRAWDMMADLCVGLGLIVAPWLFGFASQSVPTVNDTLVGVAISLIAVTSLLKEPEVRQWLGAHHRVRESRLR